MGFRLMVDLLPVYGLLSLGDGLWVKKSKKLNQNCLILRLLQKYNFATKAQKHKDSLILNL